MADKVCDPFQGWENIGHVWAHCRGLEDACVEVELIDVSETQAQIKITRTFGEEEIYFIDDGEVYGFWESTSNSPYWTITCNGVSKSMAAASIEICYEEADNGDDEEEGTEVGEDFVSGGETFRVKEIFCATSSALVTHVNSGTTKEVWLKKATIFVIPGGLQLYMIGVAIDATCRYFAERSLTLPKEIPDEPIPDNEDGSKGPFDETTFIAKKRAKIIDKMGQEFADNISDDTIIKKDNDVWKNKASLDCFQSVMRALAAGEIDDAQANRLINACIIDASTDQIIEIVLIENFKLTVPTIVMAGDVEISGTAPKANADFEIRAVRKWFGFDAFATDKLLASMTSDADYKFKTTVALEEFGALTIYAKAPKEWFEIWKADIESERHTVWVLTWGVVLALVAALALMYDKKMKGKFIGVFKKK